MIYSVNTHSLCNCVLSLCESCTCTRDVHKILKVETKMRPRHSNNNINNNNNNTTTDDTGLWQQLTSLEQIMYS